MRSSAAKFSAVEAAELKWTAMEQPSDARAWLVAEPMPPVAPVMRARWLERSVVSIAN